MTTIPKLRRPDQNTGLRAPTARDVQTADCPGGGLHVLVNDARARTYCRGCGVEWSVLDAELNQRGESWLG